MASAMLKSLKKKGADIRFACQEICGAAVAEGSQMFQTRALASVRRESKFHNRIAKDLPRVDEIKLPIQVKKRLKYKKFSSLDCRCLYASRPLGVEGTL